MVGGEQDVAFLSWGCELLFGLQGGTRPMPLVAEDRLVLPARQLPVGAGSGGGAQQQCVRGRDLLFSQWKGTSNTFLISLCNAFCRF